MSNNRTESFSSENAHAGRALEILHLLYSGWKLMETASSLQAGARKLIHLWRRSGYNDALHINC